MLSTLTSVTERQDQLIFPRFLNTYMYMFLKKMSSFVAPSYIPAQNCESEASFKKLAFLTQWNILVHTLHPIFTISLKLFPLGSSCRNVALWKKYWDWSDRDLQRPIALCSYLGRECGHSFDETWTQHPLQKILDETLTPPPPKDTMCQVAWYYWSHVSGEVENVTI